MSFRCPQCNTSRVRVKDSRGYPEESAFRRVRECLECGYGFVTLETVVREVGKRKQRSLLREAESNTKGRAIETVAAELESAVVDVIRRYLPREGQES